jgi:Flp pilus assembly protein TadD
VAYQRGEWPVAIERFRLILREDESDSLTRSALGWALYYKGDQTAAQATFQDVAKREPSWADPLVGLAWIAERRGREAEAKARFREAIDKSAPYVATGETGAAFRALIAGLRTWADLWRDLGWALYHQRAFALAAAEFRAMQERYPTDADVARGLGFALYALKRYREAVAPLEQALTGGGALPPVRERVEIPGAPGLYTIVSDAASTLAWTRYHLGEFAEALRLFREVTRQHPDWADAWSGLGWTFARRGDRVEAERAFRRSLEAHPNYPDALAGLQSIGLRRP